MVTSAVSGGNALKFGEDLNSRLWRSNTNDESARITVSHPVSMRYLSVVALPIRRSSAWSTCSASIPQWDRSVARFHHGRLDATTAFDFSRSEPPVIGQDLRVEKDLQAYIVSNAGRLDLFDGFSVVKVKYELKNDDRIDVLLDDRAKKRWLVIDLRRLRRTNRRSNYFGT